MKKSCFVLAVILMIGVMMTGCNAPQAKNGDTVQVNYTLKLADGTVIESSAGREPLEFTLGAGQVIPGFEKAVFGMKVGEKKTVTIPVDEAYGPRRDDLVGELPREKLPSGLTPEVGQQLVMTRPDGGKTMVTITGVSDNTVTIDANHPLAGKDLTFEIELVKIK
ncbi:MAG: peptidylprolyl isomerase [Dehalococcoidia bacterium]